MNRRQPIRPPDHALGEIPRCLFCGDGPLRQYREAAHVYWQQTLAAQRLLRRAAAALGGKIPNRHTASGRLALEIRALLASWERAGDPGAREEHGGG